MDIKMNKLFGCLVVTISTIVLSGCTMSFRSTPDEYNGADAAHIRISDEGNTVIRTYEMKDGCYKKVSEKRLTSALAIMGVPTSGGKKVSGMTPSNDIKGLVVKEYSIKPLQKLSVVRYYTENHTYGSFNKEMSALFYPQPNNDYDIIVGDYSITVKNITPSNGKDSTWKGEICKTGLLDW